MAYQNVQDLPSEVTGKLPQHGQQLFMAAFNAASDNGMDDKNATEVAWNSVKNSYKEDKDGNWVSIENSKTDNANIIGADKDPSDPIGNRENNAGTMRGG